MMENYSSSYTGRQIDEAVGKVLNGNVTIETTNIIEQGNMKPITSNAVYEAIGNIETALAAI